MPSVETHSTSSGTERVIVESGSERSSNWSLNSTDLGLPAGAPIKLQKTVLQGGRQAGVEVITVHNGAMTFSVIPTRGMNIHQVIGAGIRLGWDSPVKEIVHPAFVNLEARGGLGWLSAFNEVIARCGVESCGAPEVEEGRILGLHGRIANTPASEVRISVESAPPHRIRVRGRVVEQTFKFADFELWTEISTEPGSLSFKIEDQLTNLSDYDREYQLLYHANFGPPLLEAGSQFVGAIRQVAPINDYSAKDLATWSDYLGPTRDFGEQVYLLSPYARSDYTTTVMLRDRVGTCGVRMDYDTRTLPYFSLWKNTDTLKEGYVTGLEPATGYPYPRGKERAAGRVPRIRPGASVEFAFSCEILSTTQTVRDTEAVIADLRAGRETRVISSLE